MAKAALIDTTTDFQADSNGKDPDKYSPLLHQYHQLLWSKPLPNGAMFKLSDARPRGYLFHESELGRFSLSSDTLAQSFSRWTRMSHLVQQLPDGVVAQFRQEGGTIGGRVLFPGNRVDDKATINGARGFSRAIGDRIDLTLESIRRHYLGEPSPLDGVLARYADFFALFGDFSGYVDFFLFQDLVEVDGQSVRFFAPFRGFEHSPLPEDIDTYKAFLRSTLDFVEARNRRITEAASKLGET